MAKCFDRGQPVWTLQVDRVNTFLNSHQVPFRMIGPLRSLHFILFQTDMIVPTNFTEGNWTSHNITATCATIGTYSIKFGNNHQFMMNVTLESMDFFFL